MSKRVRFVRDFDHEVKTNVIVAYKAGMALSVPDPAADAAIAAKAAELVPDQAVVKAPPTPSPT